MDLEFSKKEIKKLRKLNLTDRQIDEYRVQLLKEEIINTQCRKISLDLGKTIICNNEKLYLKSKEGRFCQLLTSYKDLMCDYQKAYSEISRDIKTRLYYID